MNSKAHLLLERSSSDVSGGAELQVALLARELAHRGYTTALVHGSDSAGETRQVAGVECIPGGPFHTGAIRDVVAALAPVFGAIGRHRPRHVLVLGWTAWLFLLWVMRPFFGYRLIFICGLDTEADGRFARENGLRGRLFDLAMRRCDLIYAMSEAQQRRFGERGMKVALYRNLVLWPETAAQVPKDVDLLWIARCRPIKRPLLFLELARRLPQARCVMVCPPEDRELFAEVSKQAAALANLQLIEKVPYHKVQSYYNRARLFVNTSIAEGFANSFIQAGLGKAA
ncbi:MAG: glycosyltransferase, partial [Verrucomicrobiia bacterium]